MGCMVQKSMQMVEDCWVNMVMCIEDKVCLSLRTLGTYVKGCQLVNCVVIYHAFCLKFLSLWCVLIRSFFKGMSPEVGRY